MMSTKIFALVFSFLVFVPSVALAGIDIVGIEEKTVGGEPRIFLTIKNSGADEVDGIRTFLKGASVYTASLKPGDKITEIFPFEGEVNDGDIMVESPDEEFVVGEPLKPGDAQAPGGTAPSVSDLQDVAIPEYVYYMAAAVVVVFLAVTFWPTRAGGKKR